MRLAHPSTLVFPTTYCFLPVGFGVEGGTFGAKGVTGGTVLGACVGGRTDGIVCGVEAGDWTGGAVRGAVAGGWAGWTVRGAVAGEFAGAGCACTVRGYPVTGWAVCGCIAGDPSSSPRSPCSR